MAETKKSTPAKTESKPAKAETKSAPASKKSTGSTADKGGKNGKGSAPRNIFTEKFRSNFDGIDWSK